MYNNARMDRLQANGNYGGGIAFFDTAVSGIWALSNGTQLHFGVGNTSAGVGNGSNLGDFLMEQDGDFHADGDVIAASTSVGSDIRKWN